MVRGDGGSLDLRRIIFPPRRNTAREGLAQAMTVCEIVHQRFCGIVLLKANSLENYLHDLVVGHGHQFRTRFQFDATHYKKYEVRYSAIRSPRRVINLCCKFREQLARVVGVEVATYLGGLIGDNPSIVKIINRLVGSQLVVKWAAFRCDINQAIQLELVPHGESSLGSCGHGG